MAQMEKAMFISDSGRSTKRMGGVD